MDYYKVLEITEDASPEVIKAAYKALAKKYHPDVYKGNDTECKKKMADINEAYGILSDDAKRTIYDKQRRKQRQDFRKKDYSEPDNQESKNCNEKSNAKYSSNDTTCEENNNDTYEKKGFFGRIISEIGKGIVATIQNNNREMENAFLEGMSMNDYTLIREFKKACGYKRLGYGKALEERGFLEKNSEGQLVPTYKFKFYN